MKILLALAILGPTVIAADWRRATSAECYAESNREIKEMNAVGIYGDPPISLGMSWGSLSTGTSYNRNPCGYTDGTHFKPRFTISGPRGECDLTRSQEASLWVRHGRGHHAYRGWSEKNFKKLLSSCTPTP